MALVLISEKWSEFLVFVADVYNEKIADVLKAIVVFPLDMIDLLASNVLPVFNFIVYILIQIPIQIIFWLANGDGKIHFLECVRLIAGAFPKFSEEMKLFAQQNSMECKNLLYQGNFIVMTNQKVCSNSSLYSPHGGITQCSYLSVAEQAESCFDTSKRDAHLMNVFENFQQASAHGILSIGTSCEFINTIANITLYPLVDPLLWESLDKICNAALHALITAPIMTVQRCNLAGGISSRPAMCTPDFGPSFDYVAEAALAWGRLLTHWFDVFYLFIFDTEKGEIFQTCSKKSDYSEVFNDATRTQVLSSNFTVLVRLTSLDFALTDGTSSIFVNERGSMRRSYVPLHWPLPVDPHFGIARTFLPTGKTVSDNGIGMLGCSCSMQTGPANNTYVKMECAIVTKTGTSWILPVDWSLSSETQLLTCPRMRIVVQSLRWPQRRVLTEDLNAQGSASCGDDCLVGDAAIYVVPVCGASDGVKALACLPEKYFTRGICFPYCMALHVRNEFQRPLVMRGAAEWEQGVFMANRDCIPQIVSPITEGTAESTCRIASEQSAYMQSSSKSTGSVWNQSSCYFSVSCSSMIRQKTVLPSYATNLLDGYVPIITDAFSTDRGARLTLDLQPLVIAGGVQMRRYNPTSGANVWSDAASKEEYVVDFPTLVGNQYNEFTVEYHGSVGIPVAPRAPVPSQERVLANSHKGKIFLPQALDYVERRIPFSPATLSSEALWYATNPSYDWLKAMVSFCSSKGLMAYTQIQFLSSYSPARLWRIEYKRSSCYVEGPILRKSCSPNVSRSFPLDTDNEIPILNSTVDNSESLYTLCMTGKPMNLWVESLEDFDEYNIAVGVRRGTLSDLGFLLDGVSRGGTVFYFFSKFHERLREGIPWSQTEYLTQVRNLSSHSISFLDMSCPKLRVLPDLGSFIGHSLAAAVYLFKVPVNFIANPFAAQELLVARSRSRCPDNGLKHSALDDCGMRLISLDQFFTHVYKSNEAFWDMISWVVFLVSGGSSTSNLNPEALIFSQFLQGAVVLGEATKIVAYMDVTRSVEFMDTGIENVIFKTGRRRILQTDTQSMLSKVSSMAGAAKNGIFSLLSAIKSFTTNVLSNLFSGADASALISTQNPLTSVISASVTVPPIAWAQITYDSVVPIVLDILSFAANKEFTLKPLWVHMYDTMDRYDEIIHERHKRACMGFRLMFGYGSSTAKAIYYNCLAAAEMPRGLWTFILTILVDMNLYRCLCVLPAGRNYAESTYKQCEHLISPNRKGLWQKLISSRTAGALCEEYSKTIETQLYGAFNNWMSYSTSAAEASTNFFDELFIKRSQSMECNSADKNPTAIVLTPTPLYHYQVCTKTTSCKERCSDTIMAFESEYNRVKAYGTAMHVVNYYNHEIENPIYNIYSNEWTNKESMYVNARKFIMGILSESVKDLVLPEAICKAQCTPDAKCLKVLVETEDEFEVQIFCMPGPSSIMKTMYNIGIYSLSNIKSEVLASKQDVLTHAEFSIQNISWSSSTFLYMYVTRRQIRYLDAKETIVDANELFLWKSTDQFTMFPKSILKNSDIGNFLNNDKMTAALYGPNIELFNIQILSLNIIVTQELFSNHAGMFTVLFSFQVQIKANQRNTRSFLDLSAGSIKESSESFLIYGIRRYCDEDPSVLNLCLDNELEYFVPCDTCNSVSENTICYDACNAEIDKLFGFLNHGNLVHIQNSRYLFIPSKSNFGDESTFLFDKFVENAYTMTVDLEKHPIVSIENTYPLDKDSSKTMDIVGDWDRSKVFWTNSILSKPIRDGRAYLDQRYPTYFMSKTGMSKNSLNSEWMQQARFEYDYMGRKYRMLTKNSIAFNGTSMLKMQCEINSCLGCPTSKLRLMCAAAQDCALVKCIGTVVQTKNMFCGLGNIFEKMATHSILTWRALYLSMAEILLIVMRGLIGDVVKEVSLKFPTDQFYTLVCAVKDTYASYVGFGMSVIEMISSDVFGSSGLSQGLSLIQNNDMVSALVGEQILKISSVGSLVFNLMTGTTLLPTLAMHKWLICITNATMFQFTSSEFRIEMDDTVMDTSWVGCAKVDGLASIVNNFDIRDSLGNTIDMFVQFSKSLVTGISDTVLHGMLLSWHASMDFFIGLVWNFQDILFTFNLKSCKVPNYALRYVLWCACNDEQFRIPSDKRREDMMKGAFWCSGTLNVNLQDGTANAIIFNPYSLETLSEGVVDVIRYVNCLSERTDPTLCDSYKTMYNKKLQVLVNQNVEPLVVWTKCKSNYLQSSWDSAAGALFSTFDSTHDPKNPFLSSLSFATKQQMIAWARDVSEEFLNCMQNPSRLRMEYSTCMRLFFNIKNNQSPNAYFVYEEAISSEPPDACSVFTGISKLDIQDNVFKRCVDESSSLLDTDVSACKLNPSVWSTSQNSKTSVAKLHGNQPPWKNQSLDTKMQAASTLYAQSTSRLLAAWRAFNASFEKERQSIDVQIFSADGDFIHEFFDCMYLGPYTRVDMFPCAANLECPFYARDEQGGKTRDFTPCYGDATYNDSKSPYTCGSRGRRSIIKYYFRNIWNSKNLNLNISQKVFEKAQSIFRNYTNPASLFCYDEASQTCKAGACSLQNGFLPCLDTNFNVDEKEVSKFIIDVFLANLESYYAQTLQDTDPWTVHAGNSGPLDEQNNPVHPFKWEKKKQYALDEGFLKTSEPILKFDTEDIIDIPKASNASMKDRRLSSLWSMCMGLLSQPSFSTPINNHSWENKSLDLPVGLWEYLLKNAFYSESYLSSIKETISVNDLSEVETIVRSIVRQHIKSHNPFVWHHNKRHAPSRSSFCKSSTENVVEYQPGKMVLTDVEMHVNPGKVIKFEAEKKDDFFLNYGYLSKTIGTSHFECVCAHRLHSDLRFCQVQPETCTSMLQFKNRTECRVLWEACQSPPHTYLHSQREEVFECLHAVENTVRCPEFQLSDLWGFYPVDCSDQECEGAENWIGRGNFMPTYNRMRLVNEGRGGIRLSNYEHHQNTYQEQMNYFNKRKNASSYAIPKCYDVVEDLRKSETQESTMNLIDNEIKYMFPAVQLLYESHVTAFCSRFIIEVARIEILESIDPSIVEEYVVQALAWKKKCHNKIRQFSACNMMGMYHEIKPPSDWQSLSSELSGLAVLNAESDARSFLTPWGVVINQTSQKIFDGHVCAKNRGSYPASTSNPEMTPFLDFGSDHMEALNCEIFPSPFSFLRESGDETVPLSMLYDENGYLLKEENWIEELIPGISLETLYDHAVNANEDHVSHVLDWWPEDILDFPIGFHTTASSDPEELAPVSFDSQFLYDQALNRLFYVHTSLRNASLFHENLGACGICRSPTVGMPMFEANTNRICTRLSKHAKEDIPTFPVYQLKNGGGNHDFTPWPYSDQFIEDHFEPEFCTDTAEEIPWTPQEDDHLSKTAGNIPGWIYTASMNEVGETWFNKESSSVYPPTEGFRLHEINEAKIFGLTSSAGRTWGDCRGVIDWQATHHCDTIDTSMTCPDFRSSCLRIDANNSRGVCFPNSVYAASVLNEEESLTRYPCFASFHCPENQVCLADGGCSPMYLHVWNNEKTDMEVTVLADSCGFLQKNHPYTQSTRGASPWENIPDILDVHGFCSKHNWFTFRHSLNIELCPESGVGNTKYILCDANTTKWPWTMEAFDGAISSFGSAKTLEKAETLMIRPHACDQSFMHLQNPFNGKRFDICSGHQGEQRSVQRDAYLSYELSSDSWDGTSIYENTTNASSTNWWMRTYIESTGQIPVGKLEYDRGTQDNMLGFLGADLRLNNAFHDLVYDNIDQEKFQFTKCMDRLKCQLPPFTYNGISTMRIDSSQYPNAIQNHSERSLRLCGSVGYMEAGVCVLDIALFPLFSYFLKTTDASCSKLLWTSDTFKEKFNIISYVNDQSINKKIEERNDALHCSPTKCIYAARISDEITQANDNDHIMIIIQKLNNVVGESIDMVAKPTATVSRQYEYINQCSMELYQHTQVLQVNLQRIYESAEPSGIYLGLKLTLFELPLNWLLHAWHISLLSVVDPTVQMKSFSYMMEMQEFNLPLWTKEDNAICSNEMESSLLLYMICKNKHVGYTLDSILLYDVERYVQGLKQRITNDIINKLMIQREEMNVKCYKRASRNCDRLAFSDYLKCRKATDFVHNSTVRKDQQVLNFCLKTLSGDYDSDAALRDLDVDVKFLDPCANYTFFDLADEISLPTEYLTRYASYGTSINQIVESLTSIMKETISSNIDKVVARLDYMSLTTKSMRHTQSSNLVDIIHVKSFDKYIQEQNIKNVDIDLSNYFAQTVCKSKFDYRDPEATCKYQSEIAEDKPCLFEDSSIRLEYSKFADDDPNIVAGGRNVITIKYSDNSQQTINVCDIQARGRSEACFVQYLGEKSYIEGREMVRCDISEIYAPPGIEVQAYGYTGINQEDWNSILDDTVEKMHYSGRMCSDSTPGVKKCTLKYDPLTMKSTPDNAWWFGAFVTKGFSPEEKGWTESYMDRVTRLEVDVRPEEMEDWWTTDSNAWSQKGCYSTGVCAIKVRFEKIPGVSQTQCARSVPQCRELMGTGKNVRPYIVSKEADMVYGSLVRCAPCIRKDTNVFNNDGLFGCQLRDASNKPVGNVAETLSTQSMQEKLPYLYTDSAMQQTFQEFKHILSFWGDQDKISVSVNVDSSHPLDEKHAKYWGIKSSEEACVESCKRKPIESSSYKTADNSLWNEIIAKPTVKNIMVCTEQKLRITDLKKCNPYVDRLRKQLKTFSDTVYKKRNGVWMPVVPSGHGLAWQASVANEGVDMFTLMYQSAERNIKQVKTKYLLSEDVCGSPQSTLNDRICVESKSNSQWPIEILNPWLGGNFNPFHGNRGMDECFTEDVVAQNRRKILCPCDCTPTEFCKDPRNLYNYSDAFMNSEFRRENECLQRSFPQYHVMSDNDETNVCSLARKDISDSVCIHKQGLFGGCNLFTSHMQVDFDTLHSLAGSPSARNEYLIQTMLSVDNGLWKGRTMFEEDSIEKRYAFLKMPRSDIHPAHIAFGFDNTKTGTPLLLKKIALLRYDKEGMPTSLLHPNQWLTTLQSEYDKDRSKCESTYPNIGVVENGKGHWSCPFRKVTFWTNTQDPFFAPKVPNPLLTKILYKNSREMHPLVQLTDAHEFLKDYKTTNGLCFYEEDAQTNAVVSIDDATNPCGLKQIVQQYMNQKYALSRVMSHFKSQCMDIIDFPGLSATLRSGEAVHQQATPQKCGVLHRLTPFLMRTVGNNALLKKNRNGLKTHSEGGDCHMGRVFRYSYAQRSDLVGKQCLLKTKSKTQGLVKCEGIAFYGRSNREFYLERVSPLDSRSVANKKIRRFQRDIISGTKVLLPQYVLTGSVEAPSPEVSVGLLYRVSLAQTLAEEILHFCRGCELEGPWQGGKEFLRRYKQKTLFKSPSQKNINENVVLLKDLLFKGITFSGLNDSLSEYIHAKLKNQQLWNQSDWTWSYYTQDQNKSITRKYVGTVNASEWRKNRFKACNQSYFDSIVTNNHDIKLDFTTMQISLCEPAPTGSLQELCKAFLQYRQEIQIINCQVMGNNDCLYKPSMFYLPYEWSTTNQRFSTETVRNYYEQIFKTYMPYAEFSAYCPAHSVLDSKLISMSKQVEQVCPANKIEYLKDALESIKYLGSRVLYLGYCMLMFAINIMAMIFAKTAEASKEMFLTAMTYFKFFIDEVTQIAMPILNAVIELIFGISDAGKVFKFIIEFICDRFNMTLDALVYGIWCPVALPMIWNIFSWLKVLVIMDSNAVGQLDNAWNEISRGIGSQYNYQKCLAVFGGRIKCRYQPDTGKFNETTFTTQPFATRCWVSSQNSGYSHIFSGSSEFAYLACSVGDTCAKDSTMFDDYQQGKLIPCASCPNIDTGPSFGCNTYLKRCTCSTQTKSISSCLSNSDCQQSQATCSMATSIDKVRASAASMECSTCGQLNQESICIIDGADDAGVCACASVQQTSFLQTCSEEFTGGIALVDPTKQCFVSNNRNFINVEDVTIQMDFTDLAVGPCALGKVQRGNILCMRVTLPLASKTSSLTKTFVVLVNFQTQTENVFSVLNTLNRRRLLSQDMPLVQTCIEFSKNESRSAVKECIAMLELSEILKTWHGISAAFEKDPLILAKHGSLWFMHPELRHEILQNEFALKIITEKLNGYPLFSGVAYLGMQWLQHNQSQHNTSPGHQQRKLLQVQTEQPPPSAFACASLEYISSEIASAFWTTIRYYDKQSHNISASSVFFYDFPDFANDSLVDVDTDSVYKLIAYKALSLLFSGGNVEGKRILKSFVSNISSEEAMEKNYFTGNRFISDISKCNYSRLTFGPEPPRSVLPWFCILFLIVFMISSCCSSSNAISILLWVVVFPVIFLWSAYNISPLCFPMIPPKLPHDLITEFKAVIPSRIDIPYFLIEPPCLTYKKITNKTLSKLVPDSSKVLTTLKNQNKEACFKKCTDSPFLMKSWQDPMAWWMCELSTSGCRALGSYTERIALLKDFTSSTYYFAKVVDSGKLDQDFMKAHRFCAFFTTHEIVISGILCITVLLIVPSVVQSAFDIFLNSIVLVIHANNAENID